MDLNKLQDQIIEEFSIYDDWMDKYQYLIDLGKVLPLIDEREKKDGNLINGCQSKVWLISRFEGGKIFFTADSDAIITKGIVSLLIRVLSDRTPKEIKEADLYFIDKIGLREHLSPTRANGLLAMVKQMKMYAIAYESMKS